MQMIAPYLIAAFMAAFTFFYLRQLFSKKSSPTLSMFVIFSTGTLLSLLTYLSTPNTSLVAGALNATDFLSVLTVAVCIYIRSPDKKLVFQSFEKKYLLATAGIVAYWAVTGEALIANVLIQIIIALGYPPTIEKLWKAKRNTEPFAGWICVVCANITSLIPALERRDGLATLYATRSLTLTLLMLSIMLFWSVKTRKALQTTQEL
ncbi:MAG: hypothetical protein ABIH21_02300 [Patescibacteria group bacterium]